MASVSGQEISSFPTSDKQLPQQRSMLLSQSILNSQSNSLLTSGRPIHLTTMSSNSFVNSNANASQKVSMAQVGSKTYVIRTLAGPARPNLLQANGTNGNSVVMTRPVGMMPRSNVSMPLATGAKVRALNLHQSASSGKPVSLLAQPRYALRMSANRLHVVQSLSERPVVTVRKVPIASDQTGFAGSFAKTVHLPVKGNNAADKIVSYSKAEAILTTDTHSKVKTSAFTNDKFSSTAAADVIDIEDESISVIAPEEVVGEEAMNVNSMLHNISSATTFIHNSIRPSKGEPVATAKPISTILSGDRRNIIVVSNNNTAEEVDIDETPEETRRKAALRPVLTFEGINDILDNVSFSHLTGSQMKCITYASCTMGHQVPPGLLLDVDTVDGVMLEEATTDTKTWLPRVLFSDSFVLHGEQLFDETRFKVVQFQINSSRLKRETLGPLARLAPKGEKRVSAVPAGGKDAKRRRLEKGTKKNEESVTTAGDTKETAANAEVERITNNSCDSNADGAEQQDDSSVNESSSPNNDAFYGCYMCSFTSDDENGVIRHWIKEHISEKPYVCCYCFAVFSQSYKAQLHIEKFHAGREVAVALKPSKIFTTQMVVTTDAFDPDLPVIPFDGNTTKVPTLLLDGETELPASDGGFNCKKCDFSCSSAFDLKRHLRQEHSCLRPYVCYVCGRRFSCSYDVRRHVDQFHSSKFDKPSMKVQQSHSLVDSGTATRLESVLIDNKNPTLTQKAAWNVFLEKNGLAFQCKFCDFRTDDKALIWTHAMENHSWPTSIRCTRCRANVEITDEMRARKRVSCWKCNNLITLGPSANNSIFPAGRMRKTRAMENSGGLVYVCKVCDYKTNDKSGMTRHIKYNHTACRPYSCPYCSYSAVERPKVRVHIAGHHRGLPITVIKRLEVIKQFQATIGTLYKKLTFVLDGSSQEMMDLYEGDGDRGDDGPEFYDSGPEEGAVIKEAGVPIINSVEESAKAAAPLPSLGKRASHRRIEAFNARWRGGPSMLHIDFNMTPDGRLQCEECDFVTNQWSHLTRHMQTTHKDIYAQGNHGKGKSDRKAFHCEHFRCLLCDYRCLDRSSMTRHVKYLHMSERPHKCPHCNYSNVEKTKVRLHVKTVHSGKSTYVRTNREMLTWMADEVRKFFVRVDRHGEEIPEAAGDQPSADDECKRESPDKSEQSTSNGKGIIGYSKRGRPRKSARPDYMVLNVRSKHQQAELAVDNSTERVDLMAYVKDEPVDDEYEKAAVTGVRIKDEPIDEEYDQAISSGFARDLGGGKFTRFQIANGRMVPVRSAANANGQSARSASATTAAAAAANGDAGDDVDVSTEDWELAEVKVEEEEEEIGDEEDEWMAFEYDEDELLMEGEAGEDNDDDDEGDGEGEDGEPQPTTYGDDNVLYDPKLHMTPVIVMEDVVKTIMQADTQETDAEESDCE